MNLFMYVYVYVFPRCVHMWNHATKFTFKIGDCNNTPVWGRPIEGPGQKTPGQE